eukprot:SM000259S08734  [mRNA]  locus=s259:38940:39437:+ [translate_table: standard]
MAAHAEMQGLRAACDRSHGGQAQCPPRASCAGKPGTRQRRCAPRMSCRPAAFAACEQLQPPLVGCAWCAPIDATHEETSPVGAFSSPRQVLCRAVMSRASTQLAFLYHNFPCPCSSFQAPL